MKHLGLVGVVCIALVFGTAAAAHSQPASSQQPTEPSAPAQPAKRPPTPAPAGPRQGPPPGAPRPPSVHPGPNVRVEATIRDDRPGSNVVTKVVTVVVADGEEGRVRTIVVPKGGHAAPLNVDVRPHVQSNGRILVRLALQYDLGRGPSEEAEEPPAPGAAPTVVIAPADRSSVNETVAVVLENGRPMIVTQSADAVTDRKVTVEVKATVLK